MANAQIIREVAQALASYGYTVYLSASKCHGFYTDGKRVVSFGGTWSFSVDFTGRYVGSRESGTGWQIAGNRGVPSSIEAGQWLTMPAPAWANARPVYTTPEQHLATYGKSSGYSIFNNQ